ncbi:jg17822 [Pararge aegeria aegeria]|uniref:Jg17822 protein n=1 Tax=Pararge aegeria aegeria TaxID=348720 RepID=A0A8S4SHR9_9NEOP|nr:jg17822 [Pararge aegeria aegeria]
MLFVINLRFIGSTFTGLDGTYGSQENSQHAIDKAMLGVSLPDQMRYEDIRRRTTINDIAQRVAKLKWQIVCRVDGRQGPKVLKWRPRQTSKGSAALVNPVAVVRSHGVAWSRWTLTSTSPLFLELRCLP